MIFERNTRHYPNFNMKHLLALLIVVTSFPFLNSQILVGQSDVTQSASRSGEARYQDEPYFKRKEIAVRSIQELKEGTLIVRFVSFNEKIEYLKKIGKTEKAAKEKLKYDEVNKWFINEFNTYYNFSNVVFCYGTELEDFLDGKTKNIFLNEQLEVDPNIVVKDGPIFILASQANDSYYLFDKNFNRIPEPAPHAVNHESKSYSQISIDRLFEIFRGVNSLSDSVSYFNNKLNRLLIQ